MENSAVPPTLKTEVQSVRPIRLPTWGLPCPSQPDDICGVSPSATTVAHPPVDSKSLEDNTFACQCMAPTVTEPDRMCQNLGYRPRRGTAALRQNLPACNRRFLMPHRPVPIEENIVPKRFQPGA